jgi:hypothetical protein
MLWLCNAAFRLTAGVDMPGLKEDRSRVPEWAGIVNFWIGIIGALIGLVGTIIGLRAFYFQSRDAKIQNTRLEVLAREMSTRYTGTFPKHLNGMVELVEHAHKNLRIMVDWVDYGSFSNPDMHQRLHGAIMKRLRGQFPIHVQIILLGVDQMPFSRSSPFYGKTFEQLTEDSEYNACVDSYHKYHHLAEAPTNIEEVRQMLLDAHERFQYELIDAGADIRKFRPRGNEALDWDAPGVFFWLEDDEAAVFLLSIGGNEQRGVAFRTRDANLLKIFSAAFNDFLNASVQIQTRAGSQGLNTST